MNKSHRLADGSLSTDYKRGDLFLAADGVSGYVGRVVPAAVPDGDAPEIVVGDLLVLIEDDGSLWAKLKLVLVEEIPFLLVLGIHKTFYRRT